jgi:hypothetical protein
MLVSAGGTVPCLLVMFSYIDPILFPDQLTVVEFTEGQYVYPIHKNASSLITGLALQKLNYREIEKLTEIDVYIREPFERYVSGVQTWLRFNPEYDRATALRFIREFLFLNNHFSLQFHWIVNLARVTEARVHLRDLRELNLVTDKVWHAVTRDETLLEYFHNNTKLHYYLQLDKILYEELIGQTLTFRQIKQHIKSNHQYLYQEIIERSREICTALD